MKLRQDARMLRRKALASFSSAITAFNSPVESGRVTLVLLNLQHSFEMLLKAALVQQGERVFDKRSGRSIGFEACVNHAENSAIIHLSSSEAATLRVIDAMRDDEQHWYSVVSEQVLYLHARAAVTLFDDILNRAFGERLGSHLPSRILPVSTEAPKDFDLLVDDEFSQIKDLLRPGRRARHEARGRIRTLLALEAHAEPEAEVSVKDVDRVEKGIREGGSRDAVFPRLSDVTATVEGVGLSVSVHFSKREGAPVRYVSDESVSAAGIREVDLDRKFYLSATELASKLRLTVPRSVALRKHLGLDVDERSMYTFVMGSQRHPRFSDAAVAKMKKAVDQLDMDQIWAAHKPQGRGAPRGACDVPGCEAV